MLACASDLQLAGMSRLPGLFGHYQDQIDRAFQESKSKTRNRAAEIPVDDNVLSVRYREGFALREQGKLMQAAEKFKNFIGTYEEVLGKDNRMVLGSYDQLAGIYFETGHDKDASPLFKVLEERHNKIDGSTNVTTLFFAQRYLQTLVNLKKWDKAQQKGEKLLRTLEQTKTNSKRLSKAPIEEVLANLQKWPGQKENGEKTLNITEESCDLVNFRIPPICMEMGRVYICQGEYQLSILAHQCSLSILEKTEWPGNLDTIEARQKLGDVYAEMGNFGKAAEYHEQNRDVCARTRGVKNEVYLRSTLSLARLQRKGGRDFEAEKTLRSMLPITGPNTEDPYWKRFTVKAAEQLIQLFKGMNREHDSRKIEDWMKGDAEALSHISDPTKNPIKTSTWSPRGGDEDLSFIWDIKIFTDSGDFEVAALVLDTGCQHGNWISPQLLERLSKLSSVSQDFVSPGVVDANRQPVHAAGVVDLRWRKLRGGTRFHNTKFYVFNSNNEIDILIGVEYIVQEGLVEFNSSMLPIYHSRPITKDDKMQAVLAEEARRQERKKLEQRRQAETAQASQSAGQQSQGASGGSG